MTSLSQLTDEHLRCPRRWSWQPSEVCHGEFTVDDHLRTLRCHRCGWVYPITDWGPQFLVADVPDDPFGLELAERLDQYRRLHFVDDSTLLDDPISRAFGPSIYDSSFYAVVKEEIGKLAIGGLELAVDVGCATGRSTFDVIDLLAASGTVLGVDTNSLLLEWASSLLATPATLGDETDHQIASHLRATHGSGLDKVLFCGMDALSLALASESTDLLLALNVVDRFDKPGWAIEEFARVLRPDGYLVLACPFDWPRQPGFELRPQSLSEVVPEAKFTLLSDLPTVPWSVPDARSNRLLHQYSCEVAIYRKRPSTPTSD